MNGAAYGRSAGAVASGARPDSTRRRSGIPGPVPPVRRQMDSWRMSSEQPLGPVAPLRRLPGVGPRSAGGRLPMWDRARCV